jgi:hypothetical protein
MTGHEGQVSFERQVAAFLGSMSEEIPAGRYAPPRTMLRRANVRMTGTLGMAALAIGLICLGAVLLNRSLDAAAHPSGRIGEPNAVMMSAQAAASAADSISRAAAGWVDGTLHHHSTSLGLGAAGGFTRAGWYGSSGGIGGPSGDNWLRGAGHDGWFGPPSGDRGSDGGSGGGRGGGGSGGSEGSGGWGPGGSSGRDGGGAGGGSRSGGDHGGIPPDNPGRDWAPPWGWAAGPPLQGMDVWPGPGDAGESPAVHAIPHGSDEAGQAGTSDAGSQAGTGQKAQAERPGTPSSASG